MAPKRKTDAASLSCLSLAERKHTRFDDSSDEASPRSHAVPKKETSRSDQPVEQSNLTDLRPRKCVVPDTSGEPYVFDLALSSSEDVLAAATGAVVAAYGVTPTGLQKISQHATPSGSVTTVNFAQNSSSCIYACGSGGNLHCWDTRQKEEAQR